MTLSITLLLTIFIGLGVQARAAGPGLIATAEITGKRFCEGTSLEGFFGKPGRDLALDGVSLELDLTVTFRNASTSPAIFLLTGNWYVVLSSTPANAAERKNQLVFPYYEFSESVRWNSDSFIEGDSPEPHLFRIIPPGEKLRYDWLTHLSFPIHKPTADGVGAELLGRKVFFQLDLDHELLAPNVEGALQLRWQRFGTIWDGRIRTQPIELDIPKSPGISPCTSRQRLD